MIEIEWGANHHFGVCFLALNFNVAKLKNCQILLFFVRPSAIKNKPPKKNTIDIKLDNSTSSFIPKFMARIKEKKNVLIGKPYITISFLLVEGFSK